MASTPKPKRLTTAIFDPPKAYNGIEAYIEIVARVLCTNQRLIDKFNSIMEESPETREAKLKEFLANIYREVG